MINKKDFNLIICLFENNFFLKNKKNLKFVKKLIINYKYKRILVNISSKLREDWGIFVRMESLFGFLPKISTIKTRRKSGKNKKIVFLRSTWVFKSFLTNEKKIDQVLSYVFNLHNYLYIKFILNKKKKIIRFEEMLKHFLKKNIFIQRNSLMFQNNLFFKWLDFNRKFLNIKNRLRYKTNFYNDLKKIKFYNLNFIIESAYYKCFLFSFKILLKNYRKLLIFLFKKYRRRKKNNEEAYILL